MPQQTPRTGVKSAAPRRGSGAGSGCWLGLVLAGLVLSGCASTPVLQRAREAQIRRIIFIHEDGPFAYTPPMAPQGSGGGGLFGAALVLGTQYHAAATNAAITEAARQQGVHSHHRQAFMRLVEERLGNLGFQTSWQPAPFSQPFLARGNRTAWRPVGDFRPPADALMYSFHVDFGSCAPGRMIPCARVFLSSVGPDGTISGVTTVDESLPRDEKSLRHSAAAWPEAVETAEQALPRAREFDQAVSEMVVAAAEQFVNALQGRK